MKISIFIRYSTFVLLTILGANSFALQRAEPLPIDKPLLRDAELEQQIEDYFRKLYSSREGFYVVEDRRSVKILCATNCACFARKLNENILRHSGYTVRQIYLRGLPHLGVEVVLGDIRRFYDYHVAVLIESRDKAMIVDPIVLFNTKPIAVTEWRKLFKNVTVGVFGFAR